MISTHAIAPRVYPYLVVLPFLLTGLLPDTLNPGVVTVAGLLLGGALCMLALMTALRPLSRGAALAAGSLIGSAVWFALAATWATNPTISLVGLVGLHNGAALWALGAVWVAAGLLWANARSLRETLLGVALSGAFFSVALMYEVLKDGGQRAQGYPAGLFENSNSAGELFAVAILAAVICALVSHSRLTKIASVAAGIVSGIGLYLSDSRTGLLGLAAAAAFAALIAVLPARKPRSWLLAAAPSTLAFVLTAVAVAGAQGALGGRVWQFVSVVGTDRDAIWRSALVRVGQSPVVGSGLEQFSALLHWSVAGGQLTSDGTANPHNILLAAALGGGAIGLALMLLAFTALLLAGVDIAREANRTPGMALVAATPVVLLAAGLVSWIAPASMLAVAATTGALLGAASSKAHATVEQGVVGVMFVKGAAVALGMGALLLAIDMATLIPVQYAYVNGSMRGQQPLPPSQLEQLYLRSHDPGIAEFALKSLTPALQAGDAAAPGSARHILESSENDASWSYSLALRGLVVAQLLEANNPSGFPRFERIVQAGTRADPASGIWYALAALEADRLRLADRTRFFANEALRYPMDSESRAEIEALVKP